MLNQSPICEINLQFVPLLQKLVTYVLCHCHSFPNQMKSEFPLGTRNLPGTFIAPTPHTFHYPPLDVSFISGTNMHPYVLETYLLPSPIRQHPGSPFTALVAPCC